MKKKHESTIEAMTTSVMAYEKEEVVACIEDAGLTHLEAMYVFAIVAHNCNQQEFAAKRLAMCVADDFERYTVQARTWAKRLDKGDLMDVIKSLSRTSKQDAVIYISLLEDFRKCGDQIAAACVEQYERHEQTQEV